MVKFIPKISTIADYQELIQTAQVGDVLKLEHGLEYEDFLSKVESLKESNRIIRLLYIPMGHPYYAQYGPNSVVVSNNYLITN
jgi:hypothetical protein